MKVSISDHAVCLCSQRVARIARVQTAQGPLVRSHPGRRLSGGGLRQLRVAKTPAMLVAVETLVPVLGQTLIEAARAGIRRTRPTCLPSCFPPARHLWRPPPRALRTAR